MPTFNEILTKRIESESLLHPFGAEYAALNTFKSLISEPESESQQVRVEAARTHFANEEYFSPWLKRMHEKYLHILDKTNTKFDTVQFIRYLSTTVSLPNEYLTETGSRAAFDFPSSPMHKVTQNVFAHIERYANGITGGLLSSEVPHKNTTINGPSHLPIKRLGEIESSSIVETAENEDSPIIEERNDHSEEINSFLDMIWSYKVKHIIVLGENEDRVDYFNSETELFKTTRNENNFFTITNRKTNEFHTIQITYFSVEDNDSLEDNDDTISELLKLHEEYKKNNILVHCDSGIGRTGQIRLLFALLDKYDSSNSELKKAFDDLEEIASSLDTEDDLNSEQESLIKTALDLIFKTISMTLSELRKVRYCVQSIEQFNGIFDLLYSVIHMKNIKAPKQDQSASEQNQPELDQSASEQNQPKLDQSASEQDQPGLDQPELNQATLFATLGNKPLRKEAKTQFKLQ